MGGFDRRDLWLGRGVSGSQLTTAGPIDLYLRLRSPTALSSSGASQSLEVWSREGTVGARLAVSRQHVGLPASSASRRTGWLVQWVATRETRFLDDNQWDNAGTVEVGRQYEWALDFWDSRWAIDVDARGGLVYARTGRRPNDTEPFLRSTASLSFRRQMGGFMLGARGFVGVYAADTPPAAQRALPLDGADSYQTLRNPFVRTRRAPLVMDDVQYHSPGNGNLRGFRRGLGGRWLLAGNVELERFVLRRASGLVRTASVLAFADGALVDTVAIRSFSSAPFTPVSDAGLGVRMGFEIFHTTVPLRVEFPLLVSEPRYARETIPGKDRLGFRWLISLQPIF